MPPAGPFFLARTYLGSTCPSPKPIRRGSE